MFKKPVSFHMEVNVARPSRKLIFTLDRNGSVDELIRDDLPKKLGVHKDEIDTGPYKLDGISDYDCSSNTCTRVYILH